MAMRNLYNPAELPERLSEESGSSSQIAGQAADSRRQSSVLLVSNYSPESNSFRTKCELSSAYRCQQRVIGSELHNDQDATTSERRRGPRRRSSSLGQYVAHALALGSKTNCFFGCLLLLNLLMSATNTVLLSLLVKSVQLSELSLLRGSGERALDWNAQLDGLELKLVGLGANSSLSAHSIESFEGRPLIISPASAPIGQATGKNEKGLLISAFRPGPEVAGERGRVANRLAIGRAGEPAQIVANNLIWDQVTSEPLRSQPRGHQEQKAAPTRRLLELDAGQQSIALPGNKLELWPVRASALLLADELDAQQSELSGSLEADLNVQSQLRGDLLCESRQTLRLVSRSGRLSLAARRRLELEASRLQLEAKRLHLAEGVQFLDERPGDNINDSALASSDQAGQPASQPLAAFQLALRDGQLVAVAG